MVYIKQLHPWRVSVSKALEIQKGLRKMVVLESMSSSVKRVAGVDVGYSGDLVTAGVCIFKFPELELIEVKTAKSSIPFPYVPGLLTFREGPVVIEAFKKIKNKTDVILFDGQGICHPRRMGIATHLGIILNTASIGCAKSSLCGIYKMPKEERGRYSFIYEKETGEKIGSVLRTRTGIRPVFVSPGYKIDIKQSIELVLKLCPKYRIPEPLRYAHRFSI